MPDRVIEIPGVGNIAFPDTMSEADINAAAAKLYQDANKGKPLTHTAAKTEDFVDKPQGGILSRLSSNYLQSALPSTTPSDYIEGPMYAARHPVDSAKLLGGAVVDAHKAQAAKTRESAARVISEPTIGGKLAAGAQTLGNAAATVIPVVGPAAAAAGEQFAEGDIAGGFGSMLGLLTPAVLSARAPRVRQATSSLLSKGNATRVEQALAATTNENKTRAARVAPEMVKRGIWNKDLPTLEARAAAESETAGAAVRGAVDAVADQKVDVLPLVESLERAKASAVDTTLDGRRVVIEPDQVKAIDTLQATLMDYGDQLTVGSLNKVRMKWDEVVQSAKGFTSPDVGWKAWAAREGRSVLRDELGKASPDINKVMAEYAFWQSVEDIAHATNKRRVGQNGSLLPTIAGAGGAAVMEAIVPGAGAGKLAAGAGGAALAAKLKRFVDSPGWRMFSAVQRQRLADAIASGNTTAIERAMGGGLLGATVSDAPRGRLFPVGVTAEADSESEDLAAR